MTGELTAGVCERRDNAADATCRRGVERREQRLERRRSTARVALADTSRHHIQRSSQLARQTVPTHAQHSPVG